MEKYDYKEHQRKLSGLSDETQGMYESIGITPMKNRLSQLEDETHKEEFWQNREHSTVVNQEISQIKKKIEPWEKLIRDISETAELFDLALNDEDNDMLDALCAKIDEFESRLREIENRELLSGDDDVNNCFMTIHPGAGGTESQDWANMLYRMYYRWAEKKGYAIDVIDYTPGEEAGIKSSTILIKGEYTFGFLKGERGIHRLVRISPFDANKRRHTSFASVEVIPEISEEIDVDIKETDLRIDTYRSSGAGGQHVNKTDSAVRITHLPTGIVTQCQNERSQHKNKAFAMKILRSRLYELKKKEQVEKKQEKLGEKKDISWGNQIRSYVFQPYTLVKDHRTGEETGRVDDVFDGDIDRFIFAYLKDLSAR